MIEAVEYPPDWGEAKGLMQHACSSDGENGCYPCRKIGWNKIRFRARTDFVWAPGWSMTLSNFAAIRFMRALAR